MGVVVAAAACSGEASSDKKGGGKGGEVLSGGKKFTFAIESKCPDPGIPMPGEINERKGVPYLTAGGRTLKYDISWPKGKGPHPLVVLLHPGGWYMGQRGDVVTERNMLAGQGYAAASLDYRLSVGGKNPFPAAAQDVVCGIRTLRAHAARYNVDRGRVLAMGPSAGGHLAMLVATAGQDRRLWGTCPVADQPVDLSGAVAFYAPLDLRTFMGHSVPEPILSNFLGVSPDENPEKATLASPIAHLTAGAPPVMLSHGAKDILVPVGQSRNFAWKLKQLQVPHIYVELPEAEHGYFMFKGQEPYRPATCTLLAFLKTVLHMHGREEAVVTRKEPPPDEPEPGPKPEPRAAPKAEDRAEPGSED